LDASGWRTVTEKVDNKGDRLTVERVGGFAGFGGPGSHLKSVGEVALSALSAADRRTIDALFDAPARAGAAKPDGFVYRIARRVGVSVKTIDVTEEQVPEVIRRCVKGTLE
jgi:emfourin